MVVFSLMISCRKHILRDLQPYACTYPNCDLSEHFFDSRKEWYKHEIQQHRVEWFCNIDSHPQFAEQSDFLAHMESAHDTTFKTSQLSLLPSMFQCPSRSLEGNCNFCMQPSAKLKSHVSHHLEELALFSLSKPTKWQAAR